ncbi:MAG: cytochrome b/b6 domain-containing protein, partial [Porphyrobacter sp.]|nr:cytochrome b/b6 domain-containing protein [Porphyrobacter sp.]
MIEALRAWSRSYRDRGKYTPVGVAFHWIMAGLVIYQLASGWLMDRYLVGPAKLDAYALHTEIGLTLLLLGLLR